jgi:hypothetical protein
MFLFFFVNVFLGVGSRDKTSKGAGELAEQVTGFDRALGAEMERFDYGACLIFWSQLGRKRTLKTGASVWTSFASENVGEL